MVGLVHSLNFLTLFLFLPILRRTEAKLKMLFMLLFHLFLDMLLVINQEKVAGKMIVLLKHGLYLWNVSVIGIGLLKVVIGELM
jgi:hypothetical protein